MSAAPTTKHVPAHVPPELVRDFDIYNPPGAEDDYHAALKRVHELCPDIFWSPYQGGYWVATRGEDMYPMFADFEHFSSTQSSIPPEAQPPFPLLPILSDPPQHTIYRSLIAPWFTPKAVGDLEKKARTLSIELIEGFKDKGGCDFVADFAQHLPIAIFMSLVNLPYGDRMYLMKLVEPLIYHKSAEETQNSIRELSAYLGKVLKERGANPGTDMLSKIGSAVVDGKPMTDQEKVGMAILVLAGGLDTVASMLGFIAHFLSKNPGHRQQLIDNPALIPDAAEELIRRHGVANPQRRIVKDYVYKGVPFKANDRIMLSTPLHGLDDRAFPDPMKVDFSRKVSIHSIFGNGAHRCPGSFLARTEIKVFLQEWLPRIPDFQVKPGAKPDIRSGVNGSFFYLPLVWNVK